MTTNYRGAMVAPYASSAYIQELLNLGANLIRYQIVDPSEAAGGFNTTNYLAWLQTHIDYLTGTLIPQLGTSDRVVIDLHTPPGGWLHQPGKAPTYSMYTVQGNHRETFKQAWLKIAAVFEHAPKVLAYDLLNEPAGTAHQITTLYRNTVKNLNIAGYNKPCIISTPYGDPARVKDLYFFNRANVWYQVHMYKPLNVTHQGVNGFPVGKVYPGPNTGIARMRTDLKPFKDFLTSRGARGFVGEFSISTYAYGASRRNYAQDCITCFEEMNVSYCWHAWREASVWQPTDALLTTLMEAWEEND